jgi:thiamine pyrophosphate-dependent acetolactate synthase large subunit-like protein
MARRKKTITGAELFCRSLVEEGVTYLFGYTGGAIMPVYDAFPKFPKLTHIMVRHEQAAAFAAQGMARATGKPGVCIATSGPGATNLMTGIADAVATSVIGTDAFQESDIVGMLVPVTKQSYILDDPYEIPRIVKEAFYLSNTGRKGPVNIDLPKDISNAVIPDDGFDATIRYPVLSRRESARTRLPGRRNSWPRRRSPSSSWGTASSSRVRRARSGGSLKSRTCRFPAPFTGSALCPEIIRNISG